LVTTHKEKVKKNKEHMGEGRKQCKWWSNHTVNNKREREGKEEELGFCFH
jgi:hypothetical protein